MPSSNDSYVQMIGQRMARAAAIAAGRCFRVERHGSLLDIVDAVSSASLLFRSDHLVLERLSVAPGARGRRLGSILLELIAAIADEAGLRVELIAESPLRPTAADLGQRDLQAWYRRHQFVDADDVLMYRLPAFARAHAA